jgi:DNA polymerase III alpha subunit
MQTDDLGFLQFSREDLFDIIYTGKLDLCHNVLCEPSSDVEQFNRVADELGIPALTVYTDLGVSQQELDQALQSEWFMPSLYKELDVLQYLEDRCHTKEELDRVRMEYRMYSDKGLVNLLKYMIYLVDTMREKKILWGVGRGSSVASFILYLIGVHKVNSMKFGLDFEEFIR